MKTIIVAPRSQECYPEVCRVMASLGWTVTEVVCAGGVDMIAARWAAEQALPVSRFAADWTAHGPAATSKRDRKMLEYAEALVAVWDGWSPGTKHLIREAGNRGLRVHVFLRVPMELDA